MPLDEWLVNSVRGQYQALAPIYDVLYTTEREHLTEDRVLQRVFRKAITPGLAVLDIGCGTGGFIDLTGHPEDRYIGVDLCPEMVRRAKRKHPGHHFYVEDICQFSRFNADKQFDRIVSLYGPANYIGLMNMADVIAAHLKPGGWAFVMAYLGDYLPSYYEGRRPGFLQRVNENEMTYVFSLRCQGLLCASDVLKCREYGFALRSSWLVRHAPLGLGVFRQWARMHSSPGRGVKYSICLAYRSNP